MQKNGKNTFNRSKPTLGILVSSADDKFENALLKGVSDAAIAAEVNWICFTSGAIRSHHGFESQRNMLYNLVNSEIVNGLVVSGTLGHGVSHKEFNDFCLGYGPLPVISIAVSLDGIPSVVNDGYQGIASVLDHVLTVHKRQRVAFIRGPLGHREADERFRAYFDGMRANGFLENEFMDLVVAGDYTEGSGKRAAAELIRRGYKFDAVLCANDAMALGAMGIFLKEGLRIPQDVSLTGYDNIMGSRYCDPPLATVQQSIYDMGLRAGQLLVDHLLSGKKMDDAVISPSIIIRESCGCLNSRLVNASLTIPSRLTDQDELRERVVDAMSDIVPGYLKAVYRPWFEVLYDSFQGSARQDGNKEFVSILNEVLSRGLILPESDDFWQDVISAMRAVVLGNTGFDVDIVWAETLWQQARILIGEALRKHEVNMRLQAENRGVALREISEMLMSSQKLADVLEVIELELPGLGIRACYLSLFEKVDESLEQSRLIFAYDIRGRIHLEPGGILFPSRQLLPESIMSSIDMIGLVAEALYSKEERLGFMLLDVDAIDASVCGALRGLLSSALQGVILREQREQAETQLLHYQKNLERLVEDRTAELTKTNQQLEHEIEQRQKNQLERERLIQELESKNAELERFTYTVSHDLKAPLVTIKGFLGYLEMDAAKGDVVRLEKDIERIGRAADKMHDLLNELLELSRIGRVMNEPEEVPFADIVSDVLAITEGRLTKHNVKVKLIGDSPVLFGDRKRLMEVFQNLIDNSAKFMGGQSSPVIEIGADGFEHNMPILFVRDNGIGIAPEYHERIFGLFNRLDPSVDGTGIGLALVKRIIEFHGGRIWVESEPGKGAKFLFTLPSIPLKTG